MNGFNWRDYLGVARRLARRTDEASLRSAVSRAYYSAFCTARNHAATQGFQLTRTGRDHHLIQRFYSQSPATRSISTDLNRLYSARTRCDYENTVNHLQNIVRLSLLQAQGILQNFP